MQRVMATQMSAQMTNYRRLAAAANTAQATAALRLSLRSLGRFVGIGDAQVRRSPTQTLCNEALHACAPSDARLARVLAERRWPAAARCVDHVEREEAELVAVAAKRLARRTPVSTILVEPPGSWAH